MPSSAQSKNLTVAWSTDSSITAKGEKVRYTGKGCGSQLLPFFFFLVNQKVKSLAEDERVTMLTLKRRYGILTGEK